MYRWKFRFFFNLVETSMIFAYYLNIIVSANIDFNIVLRQLLILCDIIRYLTSSIILISHFRSKYYCNSYFLWIFMAILQHLLTSSKKLELSLTMKPFNKKLSMETVLLILPNYILYDYNVDIIQYQLYCLKRLRMIIVIDRLY